MNRQDLVDRVAERAGLTQRDALTAVDAVFDGIRDALKQGDRVTIVGFGAFSARTRKARQGRNPKTGETIMIPERRTAAFTPGKELKEDLAAARPQREPALAGS